MQRKLLYWLGYVTFSLLVPIFIVNIKFPFTNFFEGKSVAYTISLGAIVVLMMLFFFFRNRIVEFAKSFDRVSVLKGVTMWFVYVFPFAVAFFLLRLTAKYTAEFTFIFGWMTVSYMIGGIFHILIHKEKVDKFKKWVIE
jgi:hypothetical protein